MASSATFTLQLCIICIFVIARQVQGGTEPWKKSEKSAERGAKVELPCILISSQCGGLHSIKWYHGNTRICIFSQNVGLTRENNDLGSRVMLNYDDDNNKTYLEIPEVKLDDEGLYRCEATYLSVNRECNNVQHIILNVNVRPDYVRVTEKDWKSNLTSGESLGPFNEGTEISLKCETGEGKPVPTVEWYNGDELLKGDDSVPSDVEIGPGSNELTLTLGRNELGATLTCKVSSSALDKPLTVDVKLDVNVSPEKMDVKSVGHFVSGTEVLLQCIVSAARPPANVTWYNGTTPLLPGNERLEMFVTDTTSNKDSPETSNTVSLLGFNATEYDNGCDFTCYAENSVTMDAHLKPMKGVTTIEVLYPPIVTLRQQNITVNETENIHLYCDYVANPAELKAVVWKLNDEVLPVTQSDHYEGGVPGDETLIVKNSSAMDMGSYKCILNNTVGQSINQNTIDVSVLYKPKVKVTMDPEAPVNEADRLNVSLTCEVVDGNPMTLSTVRWFLDGDLLKELPDCARNSSSVENGMNGTNSSVNSNFIEEISTFCDIDPSKLLLEAVGRSFNGNYACEGRNDAGWGDRSDSAPVVVYYKPGPASISYEPKRVVKKGWLNINCSVQDLGKPEATGYKWFRGTHQIVGEDKSVLRIDTVNLQTRANFTCLAYNEAGDGDSDTVFIDVAARPSFIKSLNGYAGFAYNSTNVSIECWVECSPICNISWTRDGIPMDANSTDIYQTNVYHPPDQTKDDFESIQSTLVWNMTAWPDGLIPFRDNKNFTCESTGNGIGPGVKSETVFRVEFPPQNMTISKEIIDVVVDSIPDNVNCTAVAEPEPMFRWFREGSNDVISTDAVHVFKTKVPKRSNGTYICQAYNRHGARNITTNLNVLFKPECRVDEERINGEYYLVCTATANPKESDFTWSLKSDNDTLDQVGEVRDGKGYLRLDTSVTNFRTYVCVANNSIGPSLPCERGMPGNFPWWLQLEGDLLIIVIIVTAAMLLAIVICCIVIWFICRRKRAQAKYPGQATNNNHVDSVSETLPEPEGKTFYENLPFHGIQTPPNKSNNLYNYQEYYQQHQKQQKQQQHYQLQHQQQELQHYGSYTAPGTGIPSSSLSQLTLPLTRSLYHSSVVTPLETSFMPVHTQNTTGRQQYTTTHHQHHQFFTSNLHPQHRSEENRGGGEGGGGGGENNSPPLSLVHGNSDIELSSYTLDHQLQLQQSSRRSSSNQQLQLHSSSRRNERRKYTRKQHGDRSSERKSKHRRSGENRVRGGDSGIVSDTSDVLAAICSGTLIPISGATTPTLTTSRRSAAGDTTADTLIFNQYRQFLGIPESYKISYPHYYEDAINPCPSNYPESDPATNRYGSTGMVIETSTDPSNIANNLSLSDSPNIYYSELGNQVKNTIKSKRSSTTSCYPRTSEEQTLGLTPPAMTAGSITTTVTPAANSITTTVANANGSSTSATTLSVTSPNPSGAHYPELHFRDVGREIDV